MIFVCSFCITDYDYCRSGKRVKTEDGMEVDGEEEDADKDAEMEERSSDGEEPRTPKAKMSKRKKKQLKPRKSELNMEALSNEQAALAALESNQILHLRLRKKYYTEGLNFIRQIEGAMYVCTLPPCFMALIFNRDILGQLLGSTNKAEVLDAMEFFRVAWEYQFDNAEVYFLCNVDATTLNLSYHTVRDQENAASNLVQR